MPMFPGCVTDVSGITAGHYTDREAHTGCTVMLCAKGAVSGVVVQGGSPGTRETDAFSDRGMVPLVHGVVLSGGSAFGLAAAHGVMEYLEQEGIGFDTGVGKVPLVGSAVIFDLGYGRADIRPTAENGYQAAKAATNRPLEQGNVGAGTGATIGKMLGLRFLQKGGFGTASLCVGTVTVAAAVAVNAVGNIVDPATGQIVGGAFDESCNRFLTWEDAADFSAQSGQNTTIGCIATNAGLDKREAHRLALLAHDGFAMAIRPAHTMADGDTVFSLATGEVTADPNLVLSLAAEVTARAVINGVLAARSFS